MVTRHTDDYKLSAVKYALKTDNQVQTCKIFDCKRQSLQRWIKTYKNIGKISRNKTQRSSYKITQTHIEFLRKEIRNKPDIFMNDLKLLFESKFPTITISREHIARLLRDNNKSRKRLRRVHEPKTYRGQERNHKKEVTDFIAEARKYDMNKIICLDETAIYASLKPSYARCNVGKRCYVKTTDSNVFKHYSLLVAISNTGTIGWELYEKGAVNADRLAEFIRTKINSKFTDNLIIMDNAMFHKSNIVRNAVKEGGNTILYSVAYYPRSNPIEQYFSQLKHYIKKDSPIKFEDINQAIVRSIERIKNIHYNNYFLHAFRADWLRKTRKAKLKEPKLYKLDA